MIDTKKILTDVLGQAWNAFEAVVQPDERSTATKSKSGDKNLRT